MDMMMGWQDDDDETVEDEEVYEEPPPAAAAAPKLAVPLSRIVVLDLAGNRLGPTPRRPRLVVVEEAKSSTSPTTA